MNMHITRPVVIATEAGLRHLAPGLVVELAESEARQVMRQQAGNACGDEPPAKASRRKKPVQADLPGIADA